MSSTRRTPQPAAVRRPWTQHLSRAVGADTNPLCRPVDRARSRAVLVTTAGLGLAAVLGAAAAVLDLGAAHHHAAETVAHRRAVVAVVVGPALPGKPVIVGGGSTGYQAQATWTYPPGRVRTDRVDVPAGTRPGDTTTLWVGDTGRIAAAPPTEADLVADAVCVGLFTLAGASMIAGAAYGGRRHCLDQRALKAWQREWEEREPVWSGRTRTGPGTPNVRPAD